MKRNRPRSLVREINGTREHCKRVAVQVAGDLGVHFALHSKIPED